MFRDKRVTDPESGHERWLYDRRWRHFLRFSRMDTRKRYGSDREFGRKVAEMVQALEWSGALRGRSRHLTVGERKLSSVSANVDSALGGSTRAEVL